MPLFFRNGPSSLGVGVEAFMAVISISWLDIWEYGGRCFKRAPASLNWRDLQWSGFEYETVFLNFGAIYRSSEGPDRGVSVRARRGG